MGKIDDGVGMLVEYCNKFLLLRRKDTGIWEPCKGHIEEGEVHEQTIIRELFEETGIEELEIHNFIGKLTFSFISNKTGQQKTRNIYYYHILVNTDKVKLSNEHKDFVWLDKKDFLSQLEFDDIRFLIKKYFNM